MSYASKPATVRNDMGQTYTKGYGDGYDGVTVPEPTNPLDRKLAEFNTRIARLERRQIQDDADVAAGKRLIGNLLVLLGRRLRGEDGVHN